MSATTGPTTPPGAASLTSIIASLATLQRHADSGCLDVARQDLAWIDERLGELVDELADCSEAQR